MSKIEVKNLIYSYDGVKNTVDDISFSLKKGDFLSIIGRNGSGKSTIAKLLTGLLNPKSGTILIDDIELNEKNLPLIREKISIVFQNPDNQFIGTTVEDDIAFGLENRKIDPNKMKESIYKYAKITQVESLLKKMPSKLSGGQKQRSAIAAVLACEPKIIIFDEATSMLDPKGKQSITNFIRYLASTKEYIIISLTHEMDEVEDSNICMVLDKGKIAILDTPENVFNNRKIIDELGLTYPFMYLLKNSFSDNGLNLKATKLKDITEEICQYYLKK